MATNREKGLAMALASAAGLASLSCSSPAGVRVDVAVGDFGKLAQSMIVVVKADKGFAPMDGAQNAEDMATVTTQDFDGDEVLDLVVRLPGPFSGTKSFLVTTHNTGTITVSAHAVAYDATKVVATGDAPAATMGGGGHVTLATTLGAPSTDLPPVGPGTRDTDLATEPADLTLRGPSKDAQTSAVAVCDLDGDGKQDIVVGTPYADRNESLLATGAVFVVFGGATQGTGVKLSSGDASQFSFFGANSGDRLGAAVTCADLNADGVADLVVGAPGADRVYAVLGRRALASKKTVDLLKTDEASLPDATWGPATAPANAMGFGTVIIPVDADFDGKAERILVSAPTAQAGSNKGVTHLLAMPSPPAPVLLVDSDAADHLTFAGVPAAALAVSDLDGSGALDVALGDPDYTAPGEIDASGALFMFANVDVKTPKAYDATSTDDTTRPTTIIVGELGTRFGTALLALDTQGRGEDLYIGAPFAAADQRGLVYILEHQDNFFAARMRTFNAATTPKLDAAEPGAHFGSALALCVNGSKPVTTDALVVGARDASRIGDRAHTGAAFLWGGGTGLSLSLIDRVYGASAGDQLGAAVACGQITGGDTLADLVAAAPAATTDTDAHAGAVYVRMTRAAQ